MYATTSTPNHLYNSSRYPLRSRRGSLHSLDCSMARKNLEGCTRSELIDLKERNERMLRHRAVIHTLPDKGAKLKQSIRQIDVLLLNPGLLEDNITVENTYADHESALTSKLAGLSFLTPRQEARKRGIAIANARAQHQPSIFKRRNSSSVLIRRPSYLMDETELPSKVCMMSLEESVKLQEHHQRLVEENNRMLPPPPPSLPVSLDDSLSMTMRRMQLTSNQPPAPTLNKIVDEEEDDDVVPQGIYFDGMRKTGSEDQIMMSSDEEDDYSRDYDDHDEDDDQGL